MSAEIPQSVLQFLSGYIDSVPQLEALLLLWREPGRVWTEQEIASRVYVDRQMARSILQTLQRRQLIRTDSDTGGYCYSSAWDASGTLMAEVAAYYRLHLVRLATFIHSNSSSSVREFARAFDLKKDQ